jgi:hypothetical protein
MHTYKAQKGVTAHCRSQCRASQKVRLVLHKEPHQAVSSFGLRLRGAQSTQGAWWGWGGEPLHSKTSVTQEREILWQGEDCIGESPLMPVYLADENRRMLESTFFWVLSRCPFFICLFPPGCPPLMSFTPLLIGYTLGCNIGGVCGRLL